MNQAAAITYGTTTFTNPSIRFHRSNQLQLHVIRPSDLDSYPLGPLDVRSRPHGHPKSGRDVNQSQPVSAHIFFSKKSKTNSSASHMDSKSSSNTGTDYYVNNYSSNNIGLQTVPEVEVSPLEESGSGLPPMDTSSERQLAEGTATTNANSVKDMSHAPPAAPLSAGPIDLAGNAGDGVSVHAQPSKPKSISASTSSSVATVGVRASISSAVNTKDLDLDLV